MKKLNVGIVGTGHIGIRHIGHIEKYANLVAVCDIKETLVKDVGVKHNCNSYNNVDDMLNSESFDLVSVCTPNYLHMVHTVKALRNGCNVLCEKPMALSSRDCELMIHAAEQYNKRLFIVKQNRFNPPVLNVKKALDENRLGKVFCVQLSCFWNRNDKYFNSSDWKGKLRLDGGPLFTQFSHFIDLLYWLIGDIQDVSVHLGNFVHRDVIEFEDTGVVCLKFVNGAVGTINYTIGAFGKNMEGSLTIFGTEGCVKISGQYLNTIEYQNIKDYTINDVVGSKSPNDYGYYVGSMSNHDLVYQNVIDVLTNNGCIKTDIIDGFKTVQIIEKIYKGR